MGYRKNVISDCAVMSTMLFVLLQ